MAYVPPMRTIKQLSQEYRDTAVTEHFIRHLVATGEIPYSLAGKKILINADIFSEYLATGGHKKNGDQNDVKIRRIPS
jgi:LPS sulfotransferase NodH